MFVYQLFDNRVARVLYALLVTFLSLVVFNPYEFGTHDHWYMLPWIKNLQNPSLFPGDWLMGQRQYHYSLVYPLMAKSPFSLAISFFVVYFLCLFSVFYLSMSIHRLFSQKWLYLTPLFLLLPWYTPGGTFTIASHLLMRTSALPFLFTALFFHFREKPWPAWILAGMAFLVHPTTALYLAAFFGIELLLSAQRRGNRIQWLAIIPFIVLALPVFYQKITATDTGFPGFWADEYWLETIRIRSAHHAFPDAWHQSHIYSGLALLLVAILVAASRSSARIAKFLWAAVIGTVLIYVAGFIFTYLFPAFSAIQVQPFRVSRLLMLLTLLFIPIGLSRMKFSNWNVLVSLLILGLLCAGAYQQSKLHFFYFFCFVVIIFLLGFWKKSKYLAPILLVVPLGIIGVNKGFQPLELERDFLPPADRELYEWAREHSAEESMWIVPSKMMHFRNQTGRSAYVTWFDGTFGYFDYDFNTRWRERYTEVYGGFNETVSEPEVESLAQLPEELQENRVYIVKTEAWERKEPALWQNEKYFIYQL